MLCKATCKWVYGLMPLNSCLFKIPRSNIYINLKETDIFHYFCFTWNIILVKCLDSAVVSRETKRWEYWIARRPKFHVKQIRVILFFLTKKKETKGILIRNEVCLKILGIKLQKRRKNLENKEKLRQTANILLKMDFVTVFISFFVKMSWFYK